MQDGDTAGTVAGRSIDRRGEEESECKEGEKECECGLPDCRGRSTGCLDYEFSAARRTRIAYRATKLIKDETMPR